MVVNENIVEQLAKAAVEKFFDTHREQYKEFSIEDFTVLYTRLYYRAKNIVSKEINSIKSPNDFGNSGKKL